jgi:tRNA(fMet)-specific endonuclease VapC
VKVVLDTNAYCDFARGDAARVQVVVSATHLYLPFIVVAELRAGFAYGTRAAANEAVLQQFLESTRVTVLWADDATTRHYASLATQLRRQGLKIPTNDLWIAALVVQHGLILCTSDAHFNHLPQVPRC